MLKKAFFLIIFLSLISFNSCLAFDINSVSELKDKFLPKITEWWNGQIEWFNNTAKPWIGEHVGEATKNEIEKEISEASKEIPAFINSAITKIKELLKASN